MQSPSAPSPKRLLTVVMLLEEIKMKKILITGITGFAGSCLFIHCVNHLCLLKVSIGLSFQKINGLLIYVLQLSYAMGQ